MIVINALRYDLVSATLREGLNEAKFRLLTTRINSQSV